MDMMKYIKKASLLFLLFIVIPRQTHAMHIMEGFLPPVWCLVWGIASLPFLFWGMRSIKKAIEGDPEKKTSLAMSGAYIFALSAIKLPSVAGSSSHATGTGFGAILFGPAAMSVMGTIVLVFQALLLAHGGITTLGANVFSMAVTGPFAAYGIYRLAGKMGTPKWLAVFLGAAVGDMTTYIMTSFQLALAFPSEVGGVAASMVKFTEIFALTQLPLAVAEGVLTVLIFKILAKFGGFNPTNPEAHHREDGQL